MYLVRYPRYLGKLGTSYGLREHGGAAIVLPASGRRGTPSPGRTAAAASSFASFLFILAAFYLVYDRQST